MKKIIFFTLLMMVSAASFSQQTTPPSALSKQDYLKKSKNQKTVAWILAGTGSATTIISLTSFNAVNIFGSIFGDDNSTDKLNKGGTVFFVGCIVTLSSIPFFIASGKNRKKAMSLSFKNERSLQLSKQSFVYRSVPSINLKFNL